MFLSATGEGNRSFIRLLIQSVVRDRISFKARKTWVEGLLLTILTVSLGKILNFSVPWEIL